MMMTTTTMITKTTAMTTAAATTTSYPVLAVMLFICNWAVGLSIQLRALIPTVHTVNGSSVIRAAQ
jgi:hypothetical protein